MEAASRKVVPPAGRVRKGDPSVPLRTDPRNAERREAAFVPDCSSLCASLLTPLTRLLGVIVCLFV